jgi:hypothetical protein
MENANEHKHRFLWGWICSFFFNILLVVAIALILLKVYEPNIAAKEEEIMENYSSTIASAKLPSGTILGTKIEQKIVLDYKYVDYPGTEGKYYVDLHGNGTYTVTTNGSPVETKDTFTLRANLLKDDYPNVSSHCKGGSADKDLSVNYGLTNLTYLIIGLSKEQVEYTSLTFGTTNLF